MCNKIPCRLLISLRTVAFLICRSASCGRSTVRGDAKNSLLQDRHRGKAHSGWGTPNAMLSVCQRPQHRCVVYGNTTRCRKHDRQRQGIIPTSKITLVLPPGSRSHGRLSGSRSSVEDRAALRLQHPFFTGRAAVAAPRAIGAAHGGAGSAPSAPPFPHPPPTSRPGMVGSLEPVQLSAQHHGGEQTARWVRELKEKRQVLQSLFNL